MTRTANEKLMLTALEFAASALQDLCDHPAFADDAPEFNEGGVGYMALDMVREAIRIAQAGDTKEKDTFALYAPTFGLLADDFGRSFTFRSRTYKIVGCAPKSFKYPILGSRLPDGKVFKFPADHVANNLVKVLPQTRRIQ